MSARSACATCERVHATARHALCATRAARRAAFPAWTWPTPRVLRGRRPDAPRLTGAVLGPTLAAEARAVRQAAYFARKAARVVRT